MDKRLFILALLLLSGYASADEDQQGGQQQIESAPQDQPPQDKSQKDIAQEVPATETPVTEGQNPQQDATVADQQPPVNLDNQNPVRQANEAFYGLVKEKLAPVLQDIGVVEPDANAFVEGAKSFMEQIGGLQSGLITLAKNMNLSSQQIDTLIAKLADEISSNPQFANADKQTIRYTIEVCLNDMGINTSVLKDQTSSDNAQGDQNADNNQPQPDMSSPDNSSQATMPLEEGSKDSADQNTDENPQGGENQPDKVSDASGSTNAEEPQGILATIKGLVDKLSSAFLGDEKSQKDLRTASIDLPQLNANQGSDQMTADNSQAPQGVDVSQEQPAIAENAPAEQNQNQDQNPNQDQSQEVTA